jgi:hypothetical protein
LNEIATIKYGKIVHTPNFGTGVSNVARLFVIDKGDNQYQAYGYD